MAPFPVASKLIVVALKTEFTLNDTIAFGVPVISIKVDAPLQIGVIFCAIAAVGNPTLIKIVAFGFDAGMFCKQIGVVFAATLIN